MKASPLNVWVVWTAAACLAAVVCYLLSLPPKIEFPILLAAMAGPLYPLFDRARKDLHRHTSTAHPAVWQDSKDGLDAVKLNEFYKSEAAQADARLMELHANARKVGIMTAILGLASPWIAGLLALALR